MESVSYHGGWQGYGPSSPSGLITSHSVEHFNVFNLAVLGSSLLCAGFEIIYSSGITPRLRYYDSLFTDEKTKARLSQFWCTGVPLWWFLLLGAHGLSYCTAVGSNLCPLQW